MTKIKYFLFLRKSTKNLYFYFFYIIFKHKKKIQNKEILLLISNNVILKKQIFWFVIFMSRALGTMGGSIQHLYINILSLDLLF